MVWVEPDPVQIDDVEDWKNVEEKKYHILQHLETVHVSTQSESENEIPFCYRILLKTKSNFIIGIARNFPDIRKHWIWIEEQLQRILNELEAEGAKKLEDKITTKTELEMDIYRYLVTKFISLALEEEDSIESKQFYLKEKAKRIQLKQKKIEKQSSLKNSEKSRRGSIVIKKTSSFPSPPKSPSVGITKLREVLHDNHGVTYFQQFHLQEKIDQYYLQFWMEIQSFKKQYEIHEHNRIENARKLYEKYILSIDKEHVIDKELRDSVTPIHVSNPTFYLFDTIEQWLVELIFMNSFPRFLMSNLYQQYLRKIQEIRLEMNMGAPPQDVSSTIFEQMTVEFFAATFNLPREDLVAYCSCSYWQNLIRKGAMYISLSHICFYSSPTSNTPALILAFPFSEITFISQTKEKFEFGLIANSVLIPNSIRIDVGKNEHFFTNFSSQKETFTLLNQLWVLTADEMLENLEGEKPQVKKQFSAIYKEKTLREWLNLNLSVKDALQMKKRNEDYHKKFRVPMEETILEDEKCSLLLTEGKFAGHLQLSQQYACFHTHEEEADEIVIVIPFSKTKVVNRMSSDSGKDGIRVYTIFNIEFCFIDFEDFETSFANIKKHWGKLPPPVPMFRSISFKNWQETQVADSHKLASSRSKSLEATDLRNLKNPINEKITKKEEQGFYFKNKAFKLATRKGIDDKERGLLWLTLSGAMFRLQLWPGHYAQLLKYYEGQPSVATQEIEKDLHRSFPEHPFYQTEQGLSSLRRVLTAYSWRNQGIGYCQSMNIVCAILLLWLNEEEAFWMTCCICEELLSDYYDPSMIGAVADQRVFEDLVAFLLPEIYHHLKNLAIPLELISLPWFMCLYIGFLPLNATYRILDVLFSEGREIFFKIGLALFKMHEQQILEENDSSSVLTFMRKTKDNVDVEKLFKIAFEHFDSIPHQRINELYNMYRVRIIHERTPESEREVTVISTSLANLKTENQNPSVWFPKKSGISDAVHDFIRTTK